MYAARCIPMFYAQRHRLSCDGEFGIEEPHTCTMNYLGSTKFDPGRRGKCAWRYQFEYVCTFEVGEGKISTTLTVSVIDGIIL